MSSSSRVEAHQSSQASSRPAESSSHALDPESYNDGHSAELYRENQEHENPVLADSNARDGRKEEQTHRRRHRSGGFLLSSIDSDSQHGLQKGGTGSQIRRGYIQSEYTNHGEISAMERRGHYGQKTKGKERQSIGRSPLGIKAVSSENSPDSARTDNKSKYNGENQDLEAMEPFRKTSSVFDANQAQIVNLALTLSENRRRQFSAGRFASADHSGSLPLASAGNLPPATPALPSNDYLRFRSQQEQSEAGDAKRAHIKSYLKSPRDSLGAHNESSSDRNSLAVLLPAGSNAMNTGNVYPSEATLLRVEKAKIELELSYEYRRLLQYLPKIPASQTSRPSTARQSTRGFSETMEVLGKLYNPLQYIRNRKVRGRERSLLNAEGEGWKDVDAVRSWVDMIAVEQQRHDPSISDGIMLPPYPPISKTPSASNQSPGNNVDVPGASPTAGEIRPRLDWKTAPWDMLADAYWQEQSGNKALIENGKGQKLYGTQRSKALTYAGAGKIRQQSLPRRSLSIPRSTTAGDRDRKQEVNWKEGSLLERGRPRHHRLQSFASARDYSSSQDRRSGWRRRLLRSASPSSSEESEPTAGQAAPKVRSRTATSRDQQNTLILEKQVTRILAKEAKARVSTSGREVGKGEALTSDVEKRENSLLVPFKIENLQNTGVWRERRSLAQITVRPETPPDREVPQYENEALNRDPSRRSKSILEGSALGSDVASTFSPPRTRSPRQFNRSDPSSPDAISASGEGRRTGRGENPPVGGQDKGAFTQSPKTDSSMSYLSPQSAGSFNRLKKTHSGHKHAKSRDSKDFESKLRGFLKGTKIADIVGNPVARVGEFIWKRDGSDADTFHSLISPTPDASDVDDSPQKDASRTRERNLDYDSPDRSESRPELPVFRSPFRSDKSDRGRANAAGLQPNFALNQMRKPDRFSHIAPPPLDMRSVSPSPAASRIQSAQSPEEETTAERSLSSEKIRNQISQSTQRRHAIANHLSHPPTRQQTFYETALEPPSDQDSQWPGPDSLHFMNVTERLLSPLSATVKKKDVGILQCLSQSVAVISTETVQQVELRKDSPRLEPSNQSSLGVNKSVNAYSLTKIMEAKATIVAVRFKSQAMDQEIMALSANVMPRINGRLQDIERKISSELTPAVRRSGDDADKLGAELATTRTLELKRLNDSIDLFTRRKRRRLRWLRRSVYLLLEWTLVGLMWWAWLVVVMIKIMRISIGGFISTFRWLLWL
ncbi:hypothetical protein MMC10_006898 [Thelotrema lepadinum]|nr:hypothetical protein [Thelotrema lepadinum]